MRTVVEGSDNQRVLIDDIDVENKQYVMREKKTGEYYLLMLLSVNKDGSQNCIWVPLDRAIDSDAPLVDQDPDTAEGLIRGELCGEETEEIFEVDSVIEFLKSVA